MKRLVVYYSRKGGSVRRKDAADIAKWIGNAVGCDVFRIETMDIYPEDDIVFADRLRAEDWHRMNPPAKRYPAHLEDYDVIYVGFPNYAGIVPRVVYSFLMDYNLSGKRIVPFGINENPEFNGNIIELRKICVEAVVEEAFFIERKGMMKQKKAFEQWAKANM